MAALILTHSGRMALEGAGMKLPNPLPCVVTLYRQPRTNSDVKTVLPRGTCIEDHLPVPDFPGWWSVLLSNGKRGYIHLPVESGEER